MQAIVDSGQVVASLGSRILGRTTAEDIVDPATGEVIVEAGTLIDEPHIEAIEAAGVQTVKIRSVLTCETKYGVCGKCYGRDLARGTPVNMGEAVGVIAAQSIGEPGTQLTMRTFHIGGTAQVVDQSFLESSFEGTLAFRNKAIAVDSAKRTVVMGRNVQLVIIDEGGEERASHRVPYGARLFVEEGDTITRGQRLAEWDPYMRPILTEAGGTVDYEDVVEGASVVETADESTGITKRVVVDWRANPRGSELRPAVVIKDKKGKVVKAERGRDARYMLSVDSILSVDPGAHGEAGRRARAYPARERQDARHHRRSAAGGGAVRGAPAEGPRDHRRDQRHGEVRARLQEQAPDHHRAGGGGRRAGRVPDPEGPAVPSCRKATPSRRATTSSTACRRRTTSWRSRAWRSLPPISSTRSRRSTGCRAC